MSVGSRRASIATGARFRSAITTSCIGTGTLLFFLDRIGALPRVRWRRIRMLFNTGERSYDLSRPRDFWRFPMGALDKARFVLMMVRAFRKHELGPTGRVAARKSSSTPGRRLGCARRCSSR